MGSDSHLENSLGKIKARDFTLKVLAYPDKLAHLVSSHNGSEHVQLADLKGHNLLINFWASWCLSCKEEAPTLDKIWQNYANHGLVVMGVVLHDDPVIALEYAQSTAKNYLIAYDETGKMSIDYGLTGVPETLFITKDAFVYTKVVGPINPLKSNQMIKAML